jgi:HSP20 family protein
MMAYRNAANQTYDNRFTPYSSRPEMRTWNLALDAVENDDAFVISASLPGIGPDDIDVTLEDNVLTIKAETNADETVKEGDYRLRERRFGAFSRSVRLPGDVDAEGVEASYEHGVLNLVVPKAETAKPKKISVNFTNN